MPLLDGIEINTQITDMKPTKKGGVVLGKMYSDDMIIAAIMSTKTNKEAADKLGMNQRHFYNRLREKPLQAKLQAAQEKLTQEVGNQLMRSMSAAVDVLNEIMQDKDANRQTRVYAANSVIQNALKLTERETITSRLEALEDEIQ